MNKPKFETPDMTQKNIDKISQLFPNCITESRDETGNLKKAVNFELLQQMLSDDIADKDEAYEFTWVGKNAAIVEANKPIRKTLRPCKEESVNWDKTENLYIEGDNLEVLKLLQESYLGKVKMIYIDPPYNTGNDFIYRDDFAVTADEYAEESGQLDDEGNRLFKNTDSNGRFHSAWCSMIHSRLMLARNLLSDDGVIFISIDDNEVQNLRKLCDEVFGETNFFTQIIIQSNKRGQTYKQISKTHEYLLIYTKNEDTDFNELEKDGDTNDLNMIDNIGSFNIRELRNRNPKFGRFNRPGLFYPIYLNPNSIDKDGFSPVSLISNDIFSVEVYPLNSEGGESCWRWGRDKFNQNVDQKTLLSNVVAKQKGNGGYNIYEKYRKTTYKAKTIWDEVDVITEKGTMELGELDLAKYFPFPKPISLVKKSLYLGTNENDIILDFFSGSATTAHAVMQLNAEDGGKRKFIMVQLPEITDEKSEAFKAGYKNICEIGKERIRRAGKKIKEENPLTTQDLDIGFRVLKVDDSNMKDVYYAASEYEQGKLDGLESNIKEDRNDLDLLFGCLLDWGLPLSLPYTSETIGKFTVHTYNNGDLVACFNEDISEDVIKQIARKKPLRAVFRDSSFSNSASKINVFEIFKMISPETSVKVI
ncbi:MAG: site-specific DNA-methyltransferase [Spirochaetaceae bacterium]|nr:site-specific DNA-methyltransferase [Spirochaetaceae bacterium]